MAFVKQNSLGKKISKLAALYRTLRKTVKAITKRGKYNFLNFFIWVYRAGLWYQVVLLALVVCVQNRTVAATCECCRNDGTTAPTPKGITLHTHLNSSYLSCSHDTEIVFAPLAPQAWSPLPSWGFSFRENIIQSLSFYTNFQSPLLWLQPLQTLQIPMLKEGVTGWW